MEYVWHIRKPGCVAQPGSHFGCSDDSPHYSPDRGPKGRVLLGRACKFLGGGVTTRTRIIALAQPQPNGNRVGTREAGLELRQLGGWWAGAEGGS